MPRSIAFFPHYLCTALLAWSCFLNMANAQQEKVPLIKLPVNFGTAMENTPVIFGGRALLLLNHRDDTKVNTDEYKKSMYCYIQDLCTGKEIARFGEGHSFVNAFVNGSELHVFASEGSDRDWFQSIYHFTSTDLKTWNRELAIPLEGDEHLFNCSICRDEQGYVMAYESNKPVGFCFKFARSKDLSKWEKVPGLTFTGENNEYSACPVLRYFAPYYYVIYLHAAIPNHKGWVSFVARSKDLSTWQLSPSNPILEASEGEGVNNSDVDLFELEGNTYLFYATGDQQTWGSVRVAMYHGPMEKFYESCFPEGTPMTTVHAGPVATTQAAPPPRVETAAKRDQRMAWWREARFGMFIHWGLYSIPAGVWKGQELNKWPNCATWTRNIFSIPTAEWEPLIQQFDPVRYNPRDWAKLAKAAGMKYAVLTAKHHEGFCLFDSKLTDFTSMHSPARRDLVKEWLDAFRAEGIRVGFYYSLIDWRHPDYPVAGDSLHPERDRPEALAQKRDLNKYLDYMHGQVRELMTNYGTIDVLWFDFSYDNLQGEAWRGTELMKMVRTLQPQIIVNDRVGVGGDFTTPEQTIPANGTGKDWETCMTINGTWGYRSGDHDWKSADTLIRNLVDIASKGGNYLLNVGPTAEGEIPEASVDRLTHIGRWIQVNGESIYGTSASPFPQALPWGRCTTKMLPNGNMRLYLFVFDWPKDVRLILPTLGRQVTNAYLLADPQQTPITCESDNDQIIVNVPAAPSDSDVSVIVLDTEAID